MTNTPRHPDLLITPERAKTCARKLREQMEQKYGLKLKLSEAQNMVASIAEVDGGWHALAQFKEVKDTSLPRDRKQIEALMIQHGILMDLVPDIVEFAHILLDDDVETRNRLYKSDLDELTDEDRTLAVLYDLLDDDRFPGFDDKEDFVSYIVRAYSDNSMNRHADEAWEMYEHWWSTDPFRQMTRLQKRVLLARIHAHADGLQISPEPLFWPYLIERASEGSWIFRNRDYGVIGFYHGPQSKEGHLKGFKMKPIPEHDRREIFHGGSGDDHLYFFDDSGTPWGSVEDAKSYLVRLNWFLTNYVERDPRKR